MSRGFPSALSARGRRSFTLFWAALFVMSLGLQYGSLAAPPAVRAGVNVNLDQWANSPPAGWQNGDLNGSNSAYAEGKVVPFRQAIDELTAGVSTTIDLNYDFTAGGHYAYDYLATYNATEPLTASDLCSNGGGGTPAACSALGTASTFAFGGDPYSPTAGKTVNGAIAVSGLSRQLTMYGGTITAISAPVHSGSPTGNSDARITVTFTPVQSSVLLAWGGHLALSVYWLGPQTPAGAGTISGAPWHMRTQNLSQGSGNRNQDRSIQPSALQAPGSIKIVKQITGDTSNFPGGTFSFTASCGSYGTYPLGVILASGVTSGSVTQGSVPAGAPCTVTENKPLTSPGAGYSWETESYSPNPPSFTVTSGQTSTVTVSNPRTHDQGYLKITKTVSNPDGATLPATFAVNYDCGGTYKGQVSVAYPTPGFVTVSGIPTGSVCTLTEVAPTPITGYTWGTITYTPTQITIATKGDTFEIVVGNSITRPLLAVVKSVTSTSDPNPADPQSITAQPGDTVTYTVVVTNTGTADATGATMSDDLTSVLAHSTYVASSATATSGSVSFSSPTLTWTGTVPADGSVTITYQVKLSTSGWPVGTTTLPNLAVITAANSNCITGGEPCSSGTVTNVTAGTDLRITKSVDPATINGGVSTPVTYTITVTNSGTAVTFSDVMVSDPDLPTVVPFFTGTTVCSPSVSGCTWANLVGSGIDAGKLDAGQSFKVTVTGTANPNNTTDVGKHVNTADATFTPGPEQDQATISANATLTVLLTPQPALSITKGVSLSAAGPFVASLTGLLTGTTVHYQITVMNTGNVALTSVQLADDHYTLVSLGCTIPTSLAVGASFTCSYSATAPDGTTKNTATASATHVEQTVSPVQASATIVARTSILTVAKAVAGNTNGTDPILDVPSAKIGDTLTFTLTYTLGNGPVTNAVITDVLPQGYGAPTAISNDGTGAPGTWNATTRSITWKWATLSASGTVSYKVVVLTGADARPQPLTNVASIVSDQTAPASASRKVAIPGAVEAATSTPRVTPPPTDTSYVPQGSGTGNNLMLVLLALAAFGLVLGFVTPKPARARQRNRRS